MKLSLILLFVLVVSVSCGGQRDEIDSQVEKISDFLLDLIAKYDQSGAGSIPIEKYPDFLSEVLVQGHLSVTKADSISEELKDLLLNATSGFVKKYNTTEVGIQDFYFDLIKEFTVYLIDHEDQYSPLLETFFTDSATSLNNPDSEGQDEVNQNQEKEQEGRIEL